MHTRTHTPHHLWPPASANEILINGLWWRRALRLSCCVTALSPSNSIFPLFSPSFHAFEQPVPPPLLPLLPLTSINSIFLSPSLSLHRAHFTPSFLIHKAKVTCSTCLPLLFSRLSLSGFSFSPPLYVSLCLFLNIWRISLFFFYFFFFFNLQALKQILPSTLTDNY